MQLFTEDSIFVFFLRQSPGIRATTSMSQKAPGTHTPHQLTRERSCCKISSSILAVSASNPPGVSESAPLNLVRPSMEHAPIVA